MGAWGGSIQPGGQKQSGRHSCSPALLACVSAVSWGAGGGEPCLQPWGAPAGLLPITVGDPSGRVRAVSGLGERLGLVPVLVPGVSRVCLQTGRIPSS